MTEKMIDIKEFARAAHYSERLIRQYCIDGKIEGARKLADNARKWLIPASALQKLEPLTNTLIPDAKLHDKRILQEQGSSGQPMNLHEKPYEETPHKRKMRELATELAAELSLPVDFQKFIEDLTPGTWIIGQGFFVRITEAGT